MSSFLHPFNLFVLALFIIVFGGGHLLRVHRSKAARARHDRYREPVRRWTWRR